METLSKLFGSETKVKIMRLFLFNPETFFEIGSIADRVKSGQRDVNREVLNLENAGLIRRKKNHNSRRNSFCLNPQFSYLAPLQNFLINVEPFKSKELIKRIGKLGAVKLIVISGVFMKELESRADILIVGDHIKKSSLDNTIKKLESEIGKELRYVCFSIEDFKYRLSMFDKLIRDILDYPHKKILNRLGILE